MNIGELRAAVYALLAAILLGLVAAGVVDAEQEATILEVGDRLLAAIGLLVAAVLTFRQNHKRGESRD